MSETEPGVAERLARERIVESLLLRSESDTSDMAKLGHHIWKIYHAVESGEPPKKPDIEVARHYLREVEARLDDVAALYGYSRWETGVTWGELNEAERQEVEDD